MPILGIPDIVVREAVDVGIEVAIRVHIHVRNEELYDEPSMSLPIQTQFNARDCAVFYFRLKSPPAHRTNFYVFYFIKKESTLSQGLISQQNSQIHF
ncbi:MAG: hypothetical protein V4699_03430 [Patescibacteria group bacterium]